MSNLNNKKEPDFSDSFAPNETRLEQVDNSASCLIADNILQKSFPTRDKLTRILHNYTK